MISAVICTKDPRPDHLNRAIESILSQDLAEDRWELLIVDNASSSPVADLAAVRTAGDRARVVVEPRPGLTAAKECASRELASDVIVFVDDDNVLSPDYLGVVERIFGHEALGVVGPDVRPEYEEPPPSWFRHPQLEASLVIRQLPNERLYVSTIPKTDSYFPSGAGSCVRGSVLRSYFEELTEETRIEGRVGDRLSGGEDWDIALYAISAGYLVGVSGELRLTHLIPPGRVNERYLTRLAISSLDSGKKLNDKWRARFGHDVIPFFPNVHIALALAATHAALGFSPRHRIVARFHLHVARLLMPDALRALRGRLARSFRR
ncbi:MAG: glycosyltransferase [Solirubrobacteraceae bacterium]